jgi:hypothetical protein
MHHFVMRKGQDEVLGKRVHAAKAELLVVIFAMDRVVRQILKRVIHPTHIPLQAEAQPADMRRT